MPERRICDFKLQALLELTDEVAQCLNTLDGHCVVDGSTHAADGTVALQVGEALLASLGSELSVQLVVAGAEGDVHEGAGALVSCQLEQLGAFQALVRDDFLIDIIVIRCLSVL